jgi:hypothetical protein
MATVKNAKSASVPKPVSKPAPKSVAKPVAKSVAKPVAKAVAKPAVKAVKLASIKAPQPAMQNFEAFATACIFDSILVQVHSDFRSEKAELADVRARMVALASDMNLANSDALMKHIKKLPDKDLHALIDVLEGMARVANATGIGP